MKTKFYTEQTLKSWDQAAEIHHRRNPGLADQTKAPDFNALHEEFNRLVDARLVADSSVAQICCNNGKDLLSIKNKGAGYCLGIDGSSKFIEQARALANHPHYSDVNFETHNVYEIPEHHHGKFDIVAITVGVLNWMPDLANFFTVCSRLLKPGGFMLMEEMHPVLNMYEEGNPSYIAYSYFNREAQIDTHGLDYFSGEKYDAEPNYYFQHTLSDILSAAIAGGLQLQTFEESRSNIGNYCGDLASSPLSPPMAFIASWKRT
ncbi:class I SAM-dependent methyltransferase [Microbulbifer elongatus]|uniref:Class I SAM-dependent methyltransferase n=1 Tax=Microbulbifer elongatus TaxID=86173 RepID=A0ABT1P0N0_9GAMM|nr:class I SAM-dependent methyltransferase [Microbulbifer elongatus]MCQ3828601.1 class I SAM-dependent methyltransferase [Microbulbifer elongatus]